MKRTIALLLAAGSLLSLTACGSKKVPAPTKETMPLLTEASEAPETTIPPTEETVPPTTMEIVYEPVTEPTEEKPQYELDPKFRKVDETVYATRDVNIRAEPKVQSQSPGKLLKGNSVQRIGVSNDGWSAVIYDDNLFYIASEYLTTNKPQGSGGTNVSHKDVTETAAGDTVYTNHTVNLRGGPGADTAWLASIPQGTKLQRIAICSNGWSKVNYNGQVGYVAGGYITTEVPGGDAEETEPEETEAETTAPEETGTETTAPETTSPQETSPETTAPAETDPKETEPKETEPKETEEVPDYTLGPNDTPLG